MDYNGETEHSSIESKIDQIEDDIEAIEADEVVLSTGLISGGIVSIGSPTSTFSITAGTGVCITTNPLVDNSVTKVNVSWDAFTNITVTNIGTQPATFLSIDQTGSIIQSTTRLTNTDRRLFIGIGTLIHQDLATITTAFPSVQFIANPMSQLRDFAMAVGLINLTGNTVAGNANLTIIKQVGSIFDLSGNYENNPQDPNIVVNPQVDTSGSGTFTYLNQDGTLSGLITDIIPNILDDGTAYPSTTYANNRYGNQRIYLFPSGNIFIAPPQFNYSSLSNAIDAINTELFIENGNFQTNATLIGVLSVKGNTSNLQTGTDASFKNVGKFGAVSGSIAVSTLQTSYDHSSPPQVVTDATRGSMVIKRGSALDTDNVLTIQNGAGSNNVTITGNGDIEVNNLRTAETNIHLGVSAGLTTQGSAGIAIGEASGQTVQGAGAIAIGSGSGLTSQGADSIAIGTNTAFDNQGINSISIGVDAGQVTQGDQSITLGYWAGKTNQGDYTVAIGYKAGETNQVNNSIALNGTSSTLNALESGLFIKPVQELSSLSGKHIMVYDTATGQIQSDKETFGNLSAQGSVLVEVAELEYPRVAMSADSTGIYTSSHSSTPIIGDPAWEAFNKLTGGADQSQMSWDGSTTTIEGVGTVGEAWLQIDLGEMVSIERFRIGKSGSNGEPQEIYIVGSNDGTTWNNLAFFTGMTYSVGPSGINEFAGTMATTGYYRYYRMVILTRQGTQNTYVREWWLFSTVSTRPVSVFTDLIPSEEPPPVEGRVYYDSTSQVLKFYNGSAWGNV